MGKRFELKMEGVLNKQLNMDFKGYSSVKVDEFLDLVINNYQEYDAVIENPGKHLQEYEKQTVVTKVEIIELKGKQGVVQKESVAVDGNVNILKRLT